MKLKLLLKNTKIVEKHRGALKHNEKMIIFKQKITTVIRYIKLLKEEL